MRIDAATEQIVWFHQYERITLDYVSKIRKHDTWGPFY